ncbi:exocyst complex component 2-like protein [Trifolium pratense]|uniref:Exocyst complex component 2-like protein n=1 Tax=Trifolium pratense TaxID=57577 RepID=A0A2K3NL75_TRIPR|nr:exocyst complex component 2-like protein [Trifolium pratense]
MSSDSDEDELLQMALKEQSQRDLNYGKSSGNPRKPVANYVQPPSSQPKRGAPPATGKNPQSKGRVVDDDDDSEVEMLSISSGDEDNVKDQVTSSKNRGGRTPARDDDRTWDGEEPSRWKHVDEAEFPNAVCFAVDKLDVAVSD